MGLFSELLSSLIEALYPKRQSERLIEHLTPQDLLKLRVHVRDSREVTHLLPYHDPRVKALIWELKYYGSRHAAKLLSSVLADELPALLDETLSYRPLLIPIPLHKKRLRERGYNQVEWITSYTKAELQELIEHTPRVLTRWRYTKRQTDLPRESRTQNVRGAFVLKEDVHISGQVCIVVDDVATTGATLMDAKRALIEGGAASVFLIALTGAE